MAFIGAKRRPLTEEAGGAGAGFAGKGRRTSSLQRGGKEVRKRGTCFAWPKGYLVRCVFLEQGFSGRRDLFGESVGQGESGRKLGFEDGDDVYRSRIRERGEHQRGRLPHVD